MKYLVIQIGTRVIQKILLVTDELRLGNISDGSVSPIHDESTTGFVRIRQQDGIYQIVDQGCPVEVFINTLKVTEPTVISTLDIVNIGNCSLYMEEEPETLKNQISCFLKKMGCMTFETVAHFTAIKTLSNDVFQKIKSGRRYQIASGGIILLLVFLPLFLFSGDPIDESFWAAVNQKMQNKDWHGALELVNTQLMHFPENLRLQRAFQDLQPKTMVLDSLAYQMRILETEIFSLTAIDRRIEQIQQALVQGIIMEDTASVLLMKTTQLRQKMQKFQEIIACLHQEQLDSARIKLDQFQATYTTDPLVQILSDSLHIRDSLEIVATTTGNRPPWIKQLKSDASSLTSNKTICIQAIVLDPENDLLRFVWSASPGKIIGSGARVSYHAPTHLPLQGNARIQLTVSDGQHVVSKSLTILLQSDWQLTLQQTEQAEKKYFEAYRVEKDLKNFSLACKLYHEVLETAPDPGFEFHKKAKARLASLEKMTE